ncbi:RF-1 domain-containing protein [Trichophaea hybrida]|nr:RF-1 domain-containing protein [Trichophaea hybrida]
MLFLRLRPLLLPGTLPLTRAFTLTQILSGRGSEKLPPRPRTVDESEITEVFLKGSGPGGQKINKTSSAVQLIHKPTGIVVKCQETRSRSQNRKIARQLLAEKLDIETNGPHSYAMQKIEMEKRRKASSQKKRNRKYREPVEWPADPVDELVKDKNKIYVNRIVEEAVQGEEVMKRKGERINIQSKPMKPQRWDQMCPGIYEVAREVDEDKVVLCYRGYSGADLDKIAEEAKREEQFMGTLRGEWVEEVKERKL